MVYKFLLRLDYCVHAEQTSVGAGQTSAGAGRLCKGWTTSAAAERSSFSMRLRCFYPKRSVVDRPAMSPFISTEHRYNYYQLTCTWFFACPEFGRRRLCRSQKLSCHLLWAVDPHQKAQPVKPSISQVVR